MSDAPSVYVAVLNWNGWQHTIACVDSLRRLEYANARVVVVDNGSTDGSATRIRAAHPDVELIELEENRGFAVGNNVAIELALKRAVTYVWVLNNDTVVEPDALSLLVGVASSRPRIGIAGPTVWRPGNEAAQSIEAAAFQWRGEYRLPSPCPGGDADHFVDDVAGGSALLDAEMLRQIGGFEERFFHYWEDVELCARARAAGWAVRHACRARVWHAVGASLSTGSPQAQYYFVRNWLLFSRWSGRGGLLTRFRRAPRMTLGRVFGRRWLVRGRWRVALGALLGVADGARGRYGRRDLPGWLR